MTQARRRHFTQAPMRLVSKPMITTEPQAEDLGGEDGG